jgi:hypothetical protein
MPAPGKCTAVLLLSALALPMSAAAIDWEASLDLRLVNSDAPRSYMDGGFGSVRYDSEDGALQLGRARLALTQQLGETWNVHLDASMWDDLDAHPVGLTEAYLQYRPYPHSGFRLRIKAGAFYAPISLENRTSGWESPYTLSYSAIDSWLATELRTVGTEAQLEWLGSRSGHMFDFSVTGAVFGWNDGAGAVLAGNGFVLTDRQTPLGGRVGQPGVPPLKGIKPFREIDDRAGGYAALEARYLDRLVLRVLRYDNRADPTALDTVSHVIAWHTRFTSAGARLETADGWTGIVQWLDGRTDIAPPGIALAWPFRSAYVLVGKRFGRHMLSLRYDDFRVEAQGSDGDGTQNGRAFTAAYLFDLSAHWRVALEWLRVEDSSYNRADLTGASPYVAQSQLQLSVRYALGSQLR